MTADFFGLPVHSIGNRALTVDCLARGGPRIVREGVVGRQEIEEALGQKLSV